jgi:hypothetical protein
LNAHIAHTQTSTLRAQFSRLSFLTHSTAVEFVEPVEQTTRLGECAIDNALCLGGRYCFHARQLERLPEAEMTEAVFWVPKSDAAQQQDAEQRDAVCDLVKRRVHPSTLRECGVTVATLVLAGIGIESLVLPGAEQAPSESRYYLEHLIDALGLRFSDLRLLGLQPRHLRDKDHYPLAVLCRSAGMTALDLFSFNISYAALERHVLKPDARHAKLLALNLPFWERALATPFLPKVAPV